MSLLGELTVLLLSAILAVFVWAFSPDESISPVITANATPENAIQPPSTPDSASEATLKERVRNAVAPVVDLPSKVTNPLEFIPDWPADGPVSFLLLGTDNRDGDPSARTDTMIVLRVDPKTNSAILVSVPRDICVDKCETEPYRINTVLFLEGPDALKRRVGDILGMQIDYHVTMNFKGFVKLVDFFGGVDVNVPRDIEDYGYPNAADDGFDPFILRRGRHHFDGSLALKYVRTRYEDPQGDFGRIHRQQQFLAALRDQVLSPRIIFQAPTILGRLADTFETNLPLKSMPSLAKLALSIRPEALKTADIDYTDSRVYPVEGENGAKVLIANTERIQHYVANVIEEAKAAGGEVQEVLLDPVPRQQLEP